jgi:plastocyanin
MKKLLLTTTAVIFAAFAMGCGGGGEKADTQTESAMEKPAEQMASGGYMAMEVAGGGSVNGTITYAGEIPQKQKLEITKDANVCGQQPHYKEDIVVGSNKGLANVVVSLTNIMKGKDISTLGTTFELDQNGCAFKPHVAFVPMGAELAILNSDGILHNIHTYSEKNPAINIAQPGFKKRLVQTFTQPEVIRVACDVHNWMGGYIVVVDHPYYSITDAEGNFELTNVPAGTYTVQYWQETLGKQTAEVTVSDGAASDASYQFPMGSASIEQSTQFAAR